MKNLLILVLFLILLTGCGKVGEVIPAVDKVVGDKQVVDTAIYYDGAWAFYSNGVQVEIPDTSELLNLPARAKSFGTWEAFENTNVPDPGSVGFVYDIPYNYISTLEQSSRYISTVVESGTKIKEVWWTANECIYIFDNELRLRISSKQLRVYYRRNNDGT